MNVWFFDHYAGPPSTTPATRTFDLGKELVRMGHQFTIFACSFNHYSFAEEQLQPGQLFRFTELEGVRFVWIRGIPYKRNDGWRFLNMLIYALLTSLAGLWLQPRPDIIIGATVHPLAPVGAFFLSRLRGCRFWLDIVDIWPESLVDLGHLRASSLIARIISTIERFSLHNAELVTSSLPNIATYVRDQGLTGKLTVWIPIGIHSDRASLVQEAEALPERSVFTVAYAGGFAPAHALDVILEAAANIKTKGKPPVQFVLIGDGPEMARIKARISELGLTNVQLTGFISKEQLYARLAQADGCLVTGKNLPVYRYGVSFNKIFDYLLVGRPVIFALNSPNNPVADAGAGLSVPAENPEALADAIVQLCDTPAHIRREMGRRGHEFVLNEFNYAVIARRLASLF